MKAVIISIGTELTSGQTVDTNSAFLSRELAARGIETAEHITVPDDRDATAEAIRRASTLGELVIVTGGLGPTADDLTRQGLADALSVELAIDPECLATLEEFFRSRKRVMNEANRVQAMVPAGAEVIPNPVGTAPGLHARLGQAEVFVMPGVPYEMRRMFQDSVVPRLPGGSGAILHRILHTFGMGESDVGAALADLMARNAEPLVGTTVAAGMVSIRVIAHQPTMEAARALTDQTLAEIRRRLGPVVVGEEDETMAGVLGGMLCRAGQTLATAESCTGGLIATLITDISGSSRYYLGGVTAYDNRIKSSILHVPDELLARHGAVSEPVAAAMAKACRQLFASDWAISVTGVAGPTGGTPAKPVGLVYIGLADAAGVRVHESLLPGPRDIVRLRTALAAMNHLRLRLMR